MQGRTTSSSMLRYSSASGKVFTGMMSSSWTSILVYQAILSSAFGYKLPFMDQSIMTDNDAALLGKHSSFPLDNKYQWETEDKVNKESPTLIRLIREISDKKKEDSGPDVNIEKVSKSPLEKSADVNYPSEIKPVSKSPPETFTGIKYPLKVETVSKSLLEKSPDVRYPSKIETVSKSPPETLTSIKYPLKVETVSKSTLEKSPDVKYPSKIETVSKSPPETSMGIKYSLKVEMVSKSPPEKSSEVKNPLKVETISKSVLEISPDVTPKIIFPSKDPYFKPPTMALISEMETTPKSDLDYRTTVQEKLAEADTTHTEKSTNKPIKDTTNILIFASTQGQLLTSSSPKSKDIPVFTKNKADEITMLNQTQSTNKKPPTSTSSILVKYTSLAVPSNMPGDTPSKPPETSDAQTTMPDKTTRWNSDSTGSPTPHPIVTHISTEDKIHTHLMKQCMLTILILAIVCTIFIISTIGLAAKLSTIKQKQKLRHPATYTEMRCISSLLPENDQQSKLKPKRLKTFAATLEESDGDNTTLNSFLPDH